ncbi:hypothetical protein [Vulcanisaeta sp. EB80]|uniref:hypothetical protein n=1 Tax=Vulcanisaeta sp. EB80 TaxID=1650660 RepID=UPI001389DE7C|nr:hypothetical protein [Vulcanisaeta sp. EB80]
MLRSKGTVELDECIGIVEAMDRKAYTHILMSEDVVNIVLMGAVTVSPETVVCLPTVSFSTVSPGPLTAVAPQRSPAVPSLCGSWKLGVTD